MIKTLRNTKAAKDAAKEFLNVWKNARRGHSSGLFMAGFVIPRSGIMEASVRRVSNHSQQRLLRGETLSLTPKNA